MTWARTLATGSGVTEFDLVIAGCPYIFVTDAALDGSVDGDGREYVAGLMRDGLVTEETLELGEPRCRARGPTARIVDVRERATRLFARTPEKVAYLTASVTPTATVVQVSRPIFANGDVIHIGTEALLVTAGGLTTTLTVVRGFWGSVAQAHYVEDGAAMRTPEVTDWPASIEGRSVRLRVYGEGEATPTVIWRGRVARDAETVGAGMWSIGIDSPMAALSQPLGDDLRGSMQLRGAVYSTGFPFILELNYGSHSARIVLGVTGGDSPESVTGRVMFFRSQESFASTLSALIVAVTSSWGADKLVNWGDPGHSLRCVVDEESGGWMLVYRTALAVTPLSVSCKSVVDFGSQDWNEGRFFRRSPTGEYERVSTLAPDTSYVIRWFYEPYGGPAVGPMPRGGIGRPRHFRRGGPPVPRGYTQLYLYVDGLVGPADSVRIDGATIAVSETDTARNAIVLNLESTEAALPDGLTYVGGSPSIELTRSYGIGDLSTLISTIVAASPSESARGAVPWLEADEVIIGSFTLAVETAVARGAPTWARRRVLALEKPVDLDEALGAEAALFGGVIAPGSDGRLRLVLPEPRAASDAASTAIDEDAIVSDGPPEYERSSHGIANTVVIEQVDGPTYRVRDVTAFGRGRLPRVIEIKPVFRSPPDVVLTPEGAAAIARPWFALLARSYSIATVRVDYRYFSLSVGDSVTLSSSLLPDVERGARGIDGVPGVIVGRRWDHGRGVGELRVLLSHGRLAGYTPTSRVVSATLVSGTTYDLTLQVPPMVPGYAGADVWAVGDAVIVRQYDVASPVERYGTVVSVAGAVVRVTLDAAVPSGTIDLRYEWAPYVQSSQRPYVWIAGAATRDEGLVPPRPAREYA